MHKTDNIVSIDNDEWWYEMKESGQTLQSVERAIMVLECFSMDKPELSLGEIAQKTKLSKSTVYRLLATFVGLGYMKQDEMTQKYSLGFKFFHLGSIVNANTTLRSAARPLMEKLCQETLESVTLNIVEQDERVCIEIVESVQQIRSFVRLGQRNPLWEGASGKLLLAYMETQDQQRILEKAFKEGVNGADRASLLRELETIEKQGYYFTKEDRVSGTFAIAAPVFDYQGKLAGGITIAGPIQRLNDEMSAPLIENVVNAARKVSEALGFKKMAQR